MHDAVVPLDGIGFALSAHERRLVQGEDELSAAGWEHMLVAVEHLVTMRPPETLDEAIERRGGTMSDQLRSHHG